MYPLNWRLFVKQKFGALQIVQIGSVALAISPTRDYETEVLVSLQSPNGVGMYGKCPNATLLANAPQFNRSVTARTQNLRSRTVDC